MIDFRLFSSLYVLNVIILILPSSSFIDGKLLTEYSTVDFVRYYEITKLDIRVFNGQNSNEVGFLLNLSAFNRKFSAILWPDNKVFQSNVQIKIISKYKENTKWLSENLIYEGQLTDETESRVSGYFTQGQFHGQISVKDEDMFYIEALGTRFNQTQDIIYRERDIIENYTSCSHTFSLQQIRDQSVIKHRRPRSLSTHYNSCPVLVAADSMFYKHVGKSSVSTTLAKMAYYISEADKIFRSTTFYEEENETIGVVIASLVVYQDQESEGIFSSTIDIPINKYLKSWSKVNHESYCLSLLLTYRDFTEGVLGLAWLAEMNTLGGICEPWNIHYNMSFNTAIVTFLNHGRMIGDRTATLTIAHEFGHGFGAQHDPDQCQPGDKEGNYIMYEHSSDTVHQNNDKFSQCSVNDMKRILEARAHECFTDGISYCGNEIIETGEQCDCGHKFDCHIRDPCCVAKDELLNIPGCSLKSTAQCSPKAGVCCTNECKFVNDTERKVCQEETECSFTSYCKNGTCPTAMHKNDNKICNNGSNVCKNGECKGSICSYYGLNQCPCKEMGYVCQVCCNNTLMNECVPSSQFTNSILVLPDKTPCGFNMFCNDNGQCQQHTDQYYEYKDAFDVIIYWLKNKWYLFMFIAIATAAKIMFFGYYGYRHWRLHRTQRHEVQSEGLEMIHTEYPSRLQMESDQQTH